MIKYLFLFIVGITFGQAQLDSVLVCDVKFKDSKFDNPHAGSAFLMEYEGKTYACTAKHVLFFAKTDSMKTISFGDDLKSWTFVSKTHPSIAVKAGKLINENPEEPLAMPPKADWLVFETSGAIPENIARYELRSSPLTEGEAVSFLGYPYNNEKPIQVQGKFAGFTENGNLSLDVPKGTYNGCSGGPVLDAQGKLVGLVSMGYYNQKEAKMVFEPSAIHHFQSIIKNEHNNRNTKK